MGKRQIVFLVACVLVLSMLVSCAGAKPVQSTAGQTETRQAGTSQSETSQAVEAKGASTAADLTEAVADASADHAKAQAKVADGSSIPIVLNGNSITVGGAGATVAGSRVTITSPGTYSLSGSLDDGQVIVDTPKGVVGLVLNGVDINSSSGAAIHIVSAGEAVIVLANNSQNHLSDGGSRAAVAADEPNAALFSMADLTISGNGSLTVDGNYKDGIASKDGLVIAGGTITVSAQDDGIRGKDYLIIHGGKITVTAKGDGLKSDNDQDATRGYISMDDGILDITSGGDAMQAQTSILIKDGEITLSAGGGSKSRIDANTSAKGVKAAVRVKIDGGSFTINSADDAIHSNSSIVINGGTFAIATGDDGLHADSTLEVNGGNITITECYEGLESAVITINDGHIRITSRDDGLNVVAGNDGSGTNLGPAQGWGQGARPGRGTMPGPGVGPGQDAFAYSGNYYLYIHGGYIVVDAAGDGLDINGAIEMTDGVVIINGPTMNMNGALDYYGSFKITGGLLVAVGSSGMAQAPSGASTQYSLLLNYTATQRAGSLIHIQTAGGEPILTFLPTKQYQSLAFSSPALKNGSTYNVYCGGSSTGTAKDGLYQGGVYSGTQCNSFTISSVVTYVGSSRR